MEEVEGKEHEGHSNALEELTGVTYIYYDPLTEVVIVRYGFEVRYAGELGVGGGPVLVLAAEFGQRPVKFGNINVCLMLQTGNKSNVWLSMIGNC